MKNWSHREARNTRPIDSLSEYLTVQEITVKLNLSDDAIWKFIRNGELRAYRFGRSLRVRKEDLERWERKCLIKFRGRPLKNYSEEAIPEEEKPSK